jgi:DNA repair exonuclease SbcCD ATPase subunit
MKPILFLAGALLAGAASAALTVLLVAPGPAPTGGVVSARDAVGPASGAADVQGLRGEIEMLSRTVGELQAEVERLSSTGLRQPLASVDVPDVTPESLAAAGLTPVQIEERMREVFAAEREREDEQRAAEQAERARAQAERQAERIARELNLSPADQSLLTEHLVAAGAKRRELFDSLRGGEFDREGMRASMEELRAWNSQELYRQFSPALAAQLEEMGNDVFGGGRGPGGFGGRRGGNDGGATGGGPTPPGGG